VNKRRSTLVTISVLALLMLVLTAGAATAQTSVTPGSTLPYSARLTDTSGQPAADGQFDFVFTLYESEKDDRALWSEMQAGLSVKSGNLTAVLGQNVRLSKDVADRKELWLSVSVRGPHDSDFTLLNPRQKMGPTGGGGGLTCPHSHFSDYWGGITSSYGLEVDNSYGTGDGVRGYSGATLYNYAGVYAINGGGTGGGDGGSGAYAYSSNGYGGYFESGTYRALYAKGAPAWYAGYIENPSGSTNTGLFVNGTMWVTGAKTGYVTDAALNDGPESLETGDVVVITGAAEPLTGEIPVIRVRKATTADSAAVAGVVDQGVEMQKGAQDEQAIPGVVGHEAHVSDNTAIKPGQYLLIVTLGAYKGIKVDATRAQIHAGDLLVTSGQVGYAAASTDAKMGTVIGKALGELKSGTGLIPVLVTLK
jgi:hypothetical protein